MDFGGGPVFTGVGVQGGGTWNSYNGFGGSGALLDSTGAASPITFDITSSFGNTDNTGGTNPTTNPATAALFEDYIRGAFSNNLTVTFSGLVPLQTYDLTIYASGATTSTGAVFSANFPGSTTGADRLAFVLGDNYMRHNVTADSMGMISVIAAPTNGDGAVFNGLQNRLGRARADESRLRGRRPRRAVGVAFPFPCQDDSALNSTPLLSS